MNYGVNLAKEEAEQDGTEYKFGAISPDCIYAVPIEVRDKYLPWGEKQKGKQDFMDCATRDPINKLETKFNYAYRTNLIEPENKKWLEDNEYIAFYDGIPYVEFSDRFNAIKSGTNRDGNSMKATHHSLHEDGVIPKSMLPANSKMTFNDYHDSKDITTEMENLGQEFLKRWAINYEQYKVADLETILRRDIVGLSGHAWNDPVDGVYLRTDEDTNHAFMAFGLPLTRIFDNYLDEHDNDWIKQLASDYNFYPTGYRIYVREEITPVEYKSLLEKVIELLKKILMLNTATTEEPLPTNMREQLLSLSKSLLGTNVRSGTAPQELGCADALSSVLGKITDFPNEVSTIKLDQLLSKDSRFERTTDLTPGNIIISPTDGVSIGHCGVILEEERIASNNSGTGLWTDYYTITSWVERYRTLLKLPIYVYKFKE